MRILFLTQYYPPETGAAQNRLSDQAERLYASGHQVTVITAFPSYPRGEIFDGYNVRLFMQETVNGVLVLRCWTYISKHRSFSRRLSNYFSFALASIVTAIAKTGPQDVVVVESPPLFLGLSGVFLRWWLRAKLVINVSDLWPASAVAMGVLRNRLLIRASVGLEEFIYRRSHHITGQTAGILQSIRQRVPRTPRTLITNGVDVSAFDISGSARQAKREELGFGDAFIIGYTGLHGLAQGLDTILGVAARLQANPSIVFAFFGDGPEKTRLIGAAEERGLRNVRFFAPQPRASFPALLSALDAAIVPLRRVELFKGALPNKLFDAMAAGLPIVLSIEGEAKTLVNTAGCGLCVPPEDEQQMSNAVQRLYADGQLRREFARNGMLYVRSNYDRAVIARTFEQVLTGLQDGVPALAADSASV